jgi:hypothetical protein
MSKNLTRKGLALASGAALILTSLVGFAAPANANSGGVTLSPTTGSTYTVLNTDQINLTATVSPLVPSATADAGLSWRITNADQETLLLRFGFGTATTAVNAVLNGYRANGTVIGIAANGTAIAANTAVVLNSTAADTNGDVVVDFATLNIESLVVTSFSHQASDARTLRIKAVPLTTAEGTTTTANANGLAGLGYGEGNASIAVQSWIEVSSATLVDAATASAQEAVTFVDPASVSAISEIVRARATGVTEGATDSATSVTTHLNEAGDKFLTANLRFSRTDINLNQVDLTKWNYGVISSETGDQISVTGNAIVLRPADTAWGVATGDLEVITPVGYSAANYNAYGSLLIRGAVTGDALAANKTYQIVFRHGADTAPFNDFVSPAFTTVTNSVAATAEKVTSIVTSTTDATTGATPSLRAGVNAFTYRAQAKLTNGTTDVKTANIPMVAVVTAGSLMPTGESISVSGSAKSLTRAGESVIVTGLSNADGRFSVTVTSTTAAALQSYTVTFHIADGANAGQFVADAAPITATYATATPNAVTATPAIAASSEVTVKVAITDQFGSAISTRGTAALNVELKAPTKTNLEQFKAVENGEASFTFTNYLKTGESDILTARVYVGTSTSPTYVGSLSTNVSLFAPAAVTAINVAPEVTGVVVNYVDFITGKTSAAKPGPSSGSTTYTGTVVNANGAGIPGAAVTISGTGFQFKTGTDFTVDSVTLTTDAAGTFTVDMWTTVASAAGNKLTVTAGDKTASTLVKSAIPGTLSTKNLAFSWNLPTSLVMNTTYAVTAKVTDKHGNGVSGASVKFSGFGAAQFNGAADATRTTDRTGSVTAFLRSLKDVDGPSAIGAELLATGLTFTSGEGLAAVYTDAATTAWNESLWSSTIEAQVNFLKTAPAASATGKVNVGSFNGKLVVYAAGLDGAKISWKVAGRWGVAVASGNYDIFDRPVGAAGRNVNVEIYVNGVKQLTKTVLTR